MRARAAITAGSALRQLHRYNDALHVETAALRRALPVEHVHLLIGLAADAVGLGDAVLCARRLRAAERALPPRDWRARVRLDWVRCEHALLIDDPSASVRFARAALRRSRRTGSARHEAKSLLFLGVALREAGRAGSATALREAVRIARGCGSREIAAVAARVAKE